jgi:tetratricopeptide (TPR) repeat protein
LQRDPQNTWALQRRAFARYGAGDDDGALADTELALKSNPAWTDIRLLRANIFMRQGKRDLVAAEASAMTSNSPTSEYAWVGAGKTYAALGQNDRALKALDRALAIKPLAYIYLNRSTVRPRSDVKARTADLDAALKLEPANPDVLHEKARLLSEIGDYNGALALLDRVKPDSDSDAGYPQEQRAVLLYKAGRATEAEKLFADIRAKAKTPTDFNNLCWGKATAGILLASALQDCRDALKLKPDSGAYLDSLGMVLLRLGRLDEALDAYNQAIAKGTGASSLMGRAIVYLRRGDRAHAEPDAAAARKLYAEIDAVFAGYGLKYEPTSATPAAVSH